MHHLRIFILQPPIFQFRHPNQKPNFSQQQPISSSQVPLEPSIYSTPQNQTCLIDHLLEKNMHTCTMPKKKKREHRTIGLDMHL